MAEGLHRHTDDNESSVAAYVVIYSRTLARIPGRSTTALTLRGRLDVLDCGEHAGWGSRGGQLGDSKEGKDESGLGEEHYGDCNSWEADCRRISSVGWLLKGGIPGSRRGRLKRLGGEAQGLVMKVV